MNILVTGASGYIGSQLIPRLVDAGHQVIGLVRDPIRSRISGSDKVEIRQGDLLDLTSSQKILQGIDIAYYLVHSMADGLHGFIARDYAAANNFSTAARDSSVQRIIYLGGLGECDKNISRHLEVRQDVGNILRLSGVPVTEFRAAIIIGAGSMSFEMIRYITERLPILPTPPWIKTLCQPIAIDNILDYLIKSLTEPSSLGNIYEIGGPDVLTYADIMREYAKARNLKRLLVTLPGLDTSLLAYAADVITPLPAPYLRILIEGLRSEVVVNDPSAQQLFIPELIPYHHAVRLALKRHGSGEVEAFWAGSPGGIEPGVIHKDTEGMFIEQRRTAIAARPEVVFAVIERIGGKRGWYYADWLWQLRGLLDLWVGGVGMRRGRRDADELQMGDVLDGWRVEIFEAGRLIRLAFDMIAPGPAWLQFEVQPRSDGGTLLILTAFFEPHGLAGLLYWYILYPFHLLIFSGLSRAILLRSEMLNQTQ
jgi:uncharacterized protein YbjT (DUF2867 family)